MFAIAFSLVLFMVSSISAEICHTEAVQNGSCKVINECYSLHQLSQKLPISSATADYLKKTQCGFDKKNNPKVCCLDGISTSTADPRSITSHLLPDDSTCGIATQTRIHGGTTTELDEFPWMALLQYENSTGGLSFHCGGSLISNKYVLTAAHCLSTNISFKIGKLVRVRLGEYNLEETQDCIKTEYINECADPPVNVIVEDQIAHELYRVDDKNQYHDIALLRLQKEISFTGYIKPICVPTSKEELIKTYVGKNLTAAGWGKTENRRTSKTKLKVQLPVQNLPDCYQTYDQLDLKISVNQICAGGENKRDTCGGDSGGPLMSFSMNENKDVHWYVAGIVSFGTDKCGIENWPGVYTRVSKYVEWIVKNMKS